MTGQDEGKPKEVAGLVHYSETENGLSSRKQLDLAEGRFGVL